MPRHVYVIPIAISELNNMISILLISKLNWLTQRDTLGSGGTGIQTQVCLVPVLIVNH